MQVPILNGIYMDEAADFRTAYPRNLIPVPKKQGISEGYLRPADGIRLVATGNGVDRGAIAWNGQLYRVMGNDLVRITFEGNIVTIAQVDGFDTQVSFDYSFDLLGIAAGGKLYYYNGSTVTQVTDSDLGTVVDMIWIDGYFMTTDGEFIIVTELNDPYSVNPLKYGSSEADPDPIVALLKVRNEAYAVNRYTVEVFNNIGSTDGLFPFQRVEGAQLQRGAVGTHACCVFSTSAGAGVFIDQIAFLGSGRDEPPAIWLGLNGTTQKISTREIDTILQQFPEGTLSRVVLEPRIDKSHQFLYVHLPNQCLVYDAAATAAVGEPVWFQLTSTVSGLGVYRARNLVWCYDRWNTGDPVGFNVGTLVDGYSTHFGQVVGWEFSTQILYNESHGAIIHQMELVSLPGRVAFGKDPVVWTSYSTDGENWSQERTCKAGKRGERNKRLTWLRQGHMRNYRVQKFRGTSDAHISVARLEMVVEALSG